MRQLKVLILPSEWICKDIPLGGIFIKDQALALRKYGACVDVLFCEPKSIKSFTVSKIVQNHFQITKGVEDGILTFRRHGWNTHIMTNLGGKVYSQLTISLFKAYLKERGLPDIIHAHNSLWAGFIASKLKQIFNIKYVITEHSSLFPMNSVPKQLRWVATQAFDQAEKVFAVSYSLADAIQPFIAKENISVIPNLVDTDFFSKYLGQKDGKTFRFLAIANFTRNKGFDVLIKAFARKFKDVENVFLEIGGDGNEREYLKRLCYELGVDQKVVFLGHLNRNQVRAAMWRANALVVSSYYETFGIVLIEALATGIPVIASRCGGPESFIIPEVGFLFDKGNIDQLADVMSKMHFANFNGCKLREYVVNRFSEKAVTQRLLETYQSILNN